MSNIAERIKELKREKNAVLLVHNYQRPEVQDVGDFIGDSFGLSVQASKVPQRTIVFCGVLFMAESAAVLNPDKEVLIPDIESRCPMAAMVDVEGLNILKEKHPEAATVAYVNTRADIKAEVDVCCTSSNAVKVVKSLDQKEVIFVPDNNLGLFVKRYAPEKEIILWPGYCPTHQDITVEQLEEAKREHPDAVVMVHPECTPDVIDLADAAFSTEGMINHARQSPAMEFIVGTEREHAYRLSKLFPAKKFYSLSRAVCPNMKKITLEKILASLEKEQFRVEVGPEVAERARHPLERMVEIGRGD